MRRTSLGLAFAAVLASAACGEGRAIFNIDVFSFLQSSNVDTIPYFGPLPLGTPDTIPVQQIQLLPIGLGNSIVDSVHVTATLDFVNSNGTGTVGFAIYIDSVPGVYAGAPAFQVGPVNVTGTTTTQGTLDAELVASLLPLFTRATLYVGARATATATVPPVSGVARVTGLDLRIVVQDQVF
jgi:hypothetical protein